MLVPQTVSFYTLGCKLNFAETATLGRQFDAHGFERRAFYESADVYVINTCSVTEAADRKCRKVVQQALRQNPNAYVVVVGCYAQLKPEAIAQIPGVDAVLGAAEKFRLFEVLQGFEKRPTAAAEIHRSPVTDVRDFVPSWSTEERTRAFLKLQDGCDYHCSFCTIPLARGASRSDTLPNIVQNAQALAEGGIQELVLSGINLGDYGKGVNHTLLEVFEALDRAPGLPPRLRISSVEPNLLRDPLIDFVAQSQRFMPHFHLPLQSGNNTVLGLMRRRYRRELYAERVARIKATMPHAAIGCDVIVGFPGEGEAEFLDTYRFLTELEVSYLHVFPYSEREGTLAPTLPGRVHPHLRAERSEALRQLSAKKRRYHAQQHLGQTRPVLWEAAPTATGQMSGFTDNYIKVTAPYDPLWVNEILPVPLGEVDAEGSVTAHEATPEPSFV